MARDLRIQIIGDASSAGRAFGQVEGRAKGLSSKLGGLGKTFGLIGGAAAIAFGKQSVDAFMDAEKSSNRLAEAFRKYPKLADTNAGAITKFAGALASKTAAEDDSIVAGAAVLAQFNLTGAQVRKTLPLLVDYARKTGQDIPSAASALGKAFQGKTRALANVGIKFKDTGDAAKNFQGITGELQAKVGGFAKSELTTTAGKLENLKNRFGNIQEVVGGALVGSVDFLTRNFRTLAPAIAGVTVAVGTYKGVVLASTIATKAFGVTSAAAWVAAAGPIAVVVGAIAAAGVAIYVFRDKIKDVLGKVGGFFKTLGITIANAFLTAYNFVIRDFVNPLIRTINMLANAIDMALGPFINFPDIPQIKEIALLGQKAPLLPKSVVGAGGAGGHRRFHSGGIVPGRFGQEVPIIARAGERVTDDRAHENKTVININVHGNVYGHEDLLNRVAAGLRRRALLAGA